MPICTYLNDWERDRPVENKVVCEWRDKARKATGVRIEILERKLLVGRFFRKEKTFYIILWPLLHPEYQIINFYSEESGTSINTVVSVEMCVAYLIGLCSGSDVAKEASHA